MFSSCSPYVCHSLYPRFYSSPYSLAPNRMIAQTPLSPYMHSPVSSYQVRGGTAYLNHSTHTFPTPNTIVCSIFSHEATATVKHHQWFFPNLLSVCFLVSSRSIVRPGCTTSHTSCSQQWVSHPVLSFCLSVILSGIILVFVFLCWPLLVLSVCVCVCVCAGHSLDPNHGPYHVHPAHIHDGPSHPAARPPVSWQHRHGQYPYHYTIHQPHTQTKVFKV